MLLEHLYRMSLEQPEHWAMFIGHGGSTANTMLQGVRIERLDSYIRGFRSAGEALGRSDEEAERYFDHLTRLGHFPPEGWHRRLLEVSGGDELAAVATFFKLLHRYLARQRAGWFVEFNSAPRASVVCNGAGAPLRNDVRLPAHMSPAPEDLTPEVEPFGPLTRVRTTAPTQDTIGVLVPMGATGLITKVLGDLETDIPSYVVSLEEDGPSGQREVVVPHALLKSLGAS